MTRRHAKYTQEQIDGALDRVRRGYRVQDAARLSGVDKSKIYRELRKEGEQ